MGERSETRLDERAIVQECAVANIQHAKNAFNEFIGMARNNVAAMEWHASTALAGAREVWNKEINFAEQYFTTSRDFAQRLTRATTVRDLLNIQATFAQSQMQMLAEQANELAGAIAKATSNAHRLGNAASA
jgi:hypothetical protein